MVPIVGHFVKYAPLKGPANTIRILDLLTLG